MKIAQIAPLFETVPPKLYGGTERVVHNLTRGLVAAGHDVTVFCAGGSNTAGDMVEVWPEALRLSKAPIHDRLAYQMRMLEIASRSAREFDIVHNHYDYPLLALARATATPLVMTTHLRLDQPLQDIRAIYGQYADVPLVSISNSQRAPLPHLNWVSTIYHGLDVPTFKFSSKPGKYLAFLGRISRDKRPDWAIDIAIKSGIPLKIAAKIDEDHPQYFERVIKPRIDGRHIEFIGEIDDHEKCDFLGGALALVFPIDWPEPFGLVMTEAMACGTPVLARPRGSVPEIVVDGVTGYVRESVDELAALAHKCATLDRTAIRLHVEANFSIERMTREYLNVYRHIISEASAVDSSSNIRRMADHRRDILHSVDRTIDGHNKGIA